MNKGPGADLRDVNILSTVTAGLDTVAVEAFGMSFFALKPADLDCIRLAIRSALVSGTSKKFQ